MDQNTVACEMTCDAPPHPRKGMVYANRKTGRRVCIVGPGYTMHRYGSGERVGYALEIFPVELETVMGLSAFAGPSCYAKYGVRTVSQLREEYVLMDFTEDGEED